MDEIETCRRDTRSNWIDIALAVGLGLSALAAYTRTLAPDILFSDSGEFQTLAYTLGTTHNTGYPIYLLLARLIGMPTINTFAWRVNFASALCAAITVGMVYLLARVFARSAFSGRFASALAALALAISTTFWSQAIIAEVYTPSAAFVSVTLGLLLLWQRAPAARRLALFAAGLLLGLSFGVHAGSALFAPPLVIFVLWTLQRLDAPRSSRVRSALAGLAGLGLGLAGFALAFLLIELNNPPSSMMRASLLPWRDAWGLSAADMDSPIERIWMVLSGTQWRSAMFPGIRAFFRAAGAFLGRMSWLEFSPLFTLLALTGIAATRQKRFGTTGGLIIGALVFVLFLVLNHQPGDQEVFFLPVYVLLAVLAGAGAERVLESLRTRTNGAVTSVAMLLAVVAIVAPFYPERSAALQRGVATFFTSEYVYPIDSPSAPRELAYSRLRNLPRNAVAIAEWRGLYAQFYVAHVEGLRPDVQFIESFPYGTDGKMPKSFVAFVNVALNEGRPVLIDAVAGDTERYFALTPLPDSDWFVLSARP